MTVTRTSVRAATAASAVVIGASAGGVELLSELLRALPEDFGAGVAIVLHLHESQDDTLCHLLARHCALPVTEARDKQAFVADHVYLAPARYHLLLERDHHLALSLDPPVRYSRPSIDVLFDSASDCYGPALCGVVLSGENDDGARGAQTILDGGGEVLVLDPTTTVHRLMPQAAIALNPGSRVLSLEEIAMLLAHLCRGSAEVPVADVPAWAAPAQTAEPPHAAPTAQARGRRS